MADRWFASSKLCNFCHAKNEGLTLSDRHWTCPHCGQAIEDRDLNAARNLRNYVKYRDCGGKPLENQSESSPDLCPASGSQPDGELVGGAIS